MNTENSICESCALTWFFAKDNAIISRAYNASINTHAFMYMHYII